MCETVTRVLFVSRALEVGGAERQLVETVRGLAAQGVLVCVALFYRGGGFATALDGLPGVTLICLEKTGRWDMIRVSRRLCRLAREFRPKTVWGFAQEPNLLALAAGRAAGSGVVWGIRRSTRHLPWRDLPALCSFFFAAAASRLANTVVYNSEAGRKAYTARGYSRTNAIVIHNGFDTKHFSPSSALREKTRGEWKVAPRDILIGIVGRLHPVKDHPRFIEAAALARLQNPSLRFVCVGPGSEPFRRELEALAERKGLGSNLFFVGELTNMPAAYNALDALVLCSKEEGFPNVIGEAMSCGIPCVTTDVGDASVLVGEAGITVKADSAAALADSICEMLSGGRVALAARGHAARQRILEHFSLAVMIDRVHSLVLSHRPQPQTTS